MIIHSLLQQLQDDGFGTVGTTLQMGVLPVNGQGDPINGIAVTARGSDVSRLDTNIQNVDFYVRNTSPLVASQTAQEILDYLYSSFANVCDLPALNGVTTETYENVTIEPTSGVEYVGVDENNGSSYVVSGIVRYGKVNN